MKGSRAIFVAGVVILSFAALAPNPTMNAQGILSCLGEGYTIYPGTDYVTNGGFEQGLTGWTTPAGGASISTTTVHSGSQAMKLDSNPNLAYAYQYLSIAPDYSVFTTWFHAKAGEWRPGEMYATELMTNWDPPTGYSDKTTAIAIYSDRIRWAVWVPFGGSGTQQTIMISVSPDTWHSFQVLIDVPRAAQCLLMDGIEIGTLQPPSPPTFSPSIVMFGDVGWLGDSGISYFDDMSVQRASRPLPDLVVDNSDIFTIPSSPFLAGTDATVNATVHNFGTANASAFDFHVWVDLIADGSFGPGDIGLTTASVLMLAVNASFSVETPWTPADPGSYAICALADPPPERVIEIYDWNNLGCQMIDVLPIPKPDYVPIDESPPSPVTIGLSLPVSLSIRVLNQGNAVAGSTANLTFSEGFAPPFSHFAVPPLGSLESSSIFTVVWRSPAVPGTYVIVADIDHDNNISESNETNNLFTWTVNVVRGPVTTLVIGAPNYDSAETFVTSSTPIDFQVTDRSGTGIRNTTYRVDGGAWKNYTATGRFSLVGEGQRVVEWYSEDLAGNVEAVSSRTLHVDNTPPSTTLSPADGPYTVETNFTLAAADSGCGVRVTLFRIDGGSWNVYSRGFVLPEGKHNISYYSSDNLYNDEGLRWREVDILSTQLPGTVETNYKPIVALIFALILAAAGSCSAKRRPWTMGAEKASAAKAFSIFSLPFVLAEIATGFSSGLTGELSIPPIVGVGTVVDMAILIAGLSMAISRFVRPRADTASVTG